MSKTPINLNNKTILVSGSPGFIGANLVIRLLPDLGAHLETGGALLASGIIESRAQEVREAAETAGFFVAEDHEEKEWHAMVIRRRGEA